MGFPKGWTAESFGNYKYNFFNPDGALRFNNKKAAYKRCGLMKHSTPKVEVVTYKHQGLYAGFQYAIQLDGSSAAELMWEQ